MIDIHSHVLFEIDDGAQNLKTSLQMCLDSYRNGCDDLVLTPHFLNTMIFLFLLKNEMKK